MSDQPFEPKPSEELARVAEHFNIDPEAVQRLRAMPLTSSRAEHLLSSAANGRPIRLSDDELKTVDTSSKPAGPNLDSHWARPTTQSGETDTWSGQPPN